MLQLIAQKWAKDAACANTDPEPFHPTRETRKHLVRAAKELCATCPVAADCLADALDRDEQFGIWGGLDTIERQRLMKTRRLV